jgi:hypothetical protein
MMVSVALFFLDFFIHKQAIPAMRKTPTTELMAITSKFVESMLFYAVVLQEKSSHSVSLGC